MRPQDVLHIMQSTALGATIEDAEAFLGLCEQRGLTPFMEASPLVMDYTKQNGDHIHTIGIKEHYAIAERWAQQSGGYTIRVRDVRKEKNGDIVARIGIVSNRDYAAVGKMCAQIPSMDFKKELSGFIVYGDAIVEAKEMQRRSPPKSKTWEWIAEKRARESAITQKFGKEPSQSRQLYTNAIAAITVEDATAALFPESQKRAALPVPQVIEGEYTEPPTAPDPGEPLDADRLAADIAHAGEVAEIDDTPFTTPEAAIQWGVTSGAFSHGAHAKNAYNKLKTEEQPQDAHEMARLWRADVARRLAEKAEAQA